MQQSPNWLNLLGIIVPGIGGAIIGWMCLGAKDHAPKQMMLSWIVSIVLSSLCYLYFPQYSVAVVSILSAFISSLVLLKSQRISANKLSFELKS